MMNIVLGTMTFSDQVNESVSMEMIALFNKYGHTELDTAFVYNKGQTETLLGNLPDTANIANNPIATKVNPWEDGGLGKESVDRQFSSSLQKLKRDSVDILYLHAPDLDTPIEVTLAAINEHYKAGRFKILGLSNYAAWQVAQIVELSKHHGWVVPLIYQGMYNALTRDVERELLLCLENYSMQFYAYNPLAGGMLTGKHKAVNSLPDDGRFATFNGYQDRYWTSAYFDVVSSFADACNNAGIKPAAAAIRWLIHHSALAASKTTHSVILGASSVAQLEQNLEACTEGPLPADIVDNLDANWDIVRPSCIKYFRP